MVVEEDEPADEYLAIEAVQNATVSRDYVTEVLYAEGSFETACEETTKGANERDECPNEDAVEEIGVPGYLANWNEELQERGDGLYRYFGYQGAMISDCTVDISN